MTGTGIGIVRAVDELGQRIIALEVENAQLRRELQTRDQILAATGQGDLSAGIAAAAQAAAAEVSGNGKHEPEPAQ